MYEKFKKLDGSHPWRRVSPDGYLDYPATFRKGGRVLFFNFPLARELGFIPKTHPDKLNKDLERVLLKTFSLQILNEYDWINKKTLPQDRYKGHLYMATRYLQLQHANKRGETSGDGRAIWNGCVRAMGKIFDVSSCGTGVTVLSPGAQEAKQYIKTGDESFGYSSGRADVDEMLSGAIMAEVFYRKSIPTERCLTVIDFSDKTAIGVRTSPNLIRPAHFFRYLKVGDWANLKAAYDYFLDRQEYNSVLKLPKGNKRYVKSLDYIAKVFAKLAALMEEEYIFNWLAWDGDNVLANGAILDYGSIRQFAAKHNKYRYDDVDRYSTSLTEQRMEARKIVQAFAQTADFIVTKKKKKIEQFKNDKSLKLFDKYFREYVHRYMLYRMGLRPKQIDRLMAQSRKLVTDIRNELKYFEEVKTVKGKTKVPDGIDHPPVFLVRHILRELPIHIYRHRKPGHWPVMPLKDFCKVMAGSYVNRKDLEVTPYRRAKILKFQTLYKKLIYSLGKHHTRTIRGIIQQASVINYAYRGTGDGLTEIANAVVAFRNKLNQHDLQEIITRFIESQVLVPGEWKAIHPDEIKPGTLKGKHLRKMHETLQLYNELI